jgi:hypothetical protein
LLLLLFMKDKMLTSLAKRLPFAVILITACSSSSPPDSSTQPTSDEKPIAMIMKASSATQAELGVVEWWVVESPNGVNAIGGVDAQRAIRVELMSDDTRSKLRTPHGTFDMVMDKPGGARLPVSAQRVLSLLWSDVAPPDANPTPPALRPASVPFPLQVHPTDRPCPNGRGALVGTCKSLIATCNDVTFLARCAGDATNILQGRKLMQQHCVNSPWPSACGGDRSGVEKAMGDLLKDNGEGEDQGKGVNCYKCLPDWGYSSDSLLGCPNVNPDNISVDAEFPFNNCNPPPAPAFSN